MYLHIRQYDNDIDYLLIYVGKQIYDYLIINNHHNNNRFNISLMIML